MKLSALHALLFSLPLAACSAPREAAPPASPDPAPRVLPTREIAPRPARIDVERLSLRQAIERVIEQRDAARSGLSRVRDALNTAGCRGGHLVDRIAQLGSDRDRWKARALAAEHKLATAEIETQMGIKSEEQDDD